MRRRVLLLAGILALALICLALVSLPPVRTDGQPEWRHATASDSVPRSIAEAEAQGERHPLPYLSFGVNNVTTFDLPSSGRWLLVATVDRNWGCFVYSL